MMTPEQRDRAQKLLLERLTQAALAGMRAALKDPEGMASVLAIEEGRHRVINILMAGFLADVGTLLTELRREGVL